MCSERTPAPETRGYDGSLPIIEQADQEQADIEQADQEQADENMIQ
jgi:hypothetical protein